VLYVGTLEPRKNLPTLLQAFHQAALDGVQLVIAGKRGWLYGDTLAQIQNLGLTPKVRELGFVPEGDLPGLYTLAEVFAFPSLYEGFGLPVLEALACGTPVIASNTSSLPEVAGSAALLVPPDDVRGWVNALIQVMQNPALRADLQKRGPSQAALFTWETAAQQMRMLYREAYARRHNNRS
jgi:glycosyltransferase involved in cell wall biosynthesis